MLLFHFSFQDPNPDFTTMATLSKSIRLVLQRRPQILVSSSTKSFSSSAFLRQEEISKAEMYAKQLDNDNPFDFYTVKPDPVTGINKRNPILIPCSGDSRMVGCNCENDYDEVVWFKLEKGGVQKCECGYYFKLIEHDPLDDRIKPKFGKGFGSLMSRYF